MINDLKIQDSELWKYVDDTTMSEIVERNNESNIQEKVDELTRHISIDKLTLRPCHTIAYRTSVCQRMKNITHTPVYADIR